MHAPQANLSLHPEDEKRLDTELDKALKNPHDRVYQPTFAGFLSEQMSPLKRSMDNKPLTMNSVTRVPGAVGWGVERPHLRA